MADEDDDFLDLCEESSSPLPDHTIDDTKSLDTSVQCTTALSRDLGAEELENYSDFETDDGSSNGSVKNHSAIFEEKRDVESISSQQKDNKLVIGSCGKPQIVSLMQDGDDDEISDDCILSFYPEKISPSSNNMPALGKTNQPKSTPRISADSFHIISDDSDSENTNKNVIDTKSNGKTGINGKTNSRMEELRQECKTNTDGCRRKGLLIMKAETISSGKFNQIQGEVTPIDNRRGVESQGKMLSLSTPRNDKRQESDRSCNQWISMSHWHTEKDTQSKNFEGVGAVVKRKQSVDDGGLQNDDISPLKKSKLIHTDGDVSSLNTPIGNPVVKTDKIRTFVSDYLSKLQVELQPPPAMSKIPDDRKYVYERNGTRGDNQKKIESHTGTYDVQNVITKAAIKVVCYTLKYG